MVAELLLLLFLLRVGGNCARSTKPSKSPVKYKQMKVTIYQMETTSGVLHAPQKAQQSSHTCRLDVQMLGYLHLIENKPSVTRKSIDVFCFF